MRVLQSVLPSRHIKLDDIKITEEGVTIKCEEKDFRPPVRVHGQLSPGRERSKEFLVPFDRFRPDLCPGSHVINYMDVMQKNLKNLRPDDRYVK